MAALDDLIGQVDDKALQDRLRVELDQLAKQKKFGLVFEEHIPEVAPMYEAKVRKNCLVALRAGSLSDCWRVLSVSGGTAHCVNRKSKAKRDIAVADLLVVREFGDPIFPALTPIDRVENGGVTAPWHTLIEADNYHALQLLEYLYTGEVDCIYIDPPYNTGARDWKYNNDYVDSNDRWRHSKWLAMMKRRLVLSRKLLKPDGVLIVTIDDNELYHLGCLLNELFAGYNHFIVGIEHNKRGRRGKNFAKSNEFAIFLVPEDKEVISEEYAIGGFGGETRNLRRTGSGSLRPERWRKYYPIYIDEQTNAVVHAGDSVPLDQPTFFEVPKDIRRMFPDRQIAIVWPIDEEGVEKNWHYGIDRTRKQIKENKLEVRPQKYGPQIYYTLREKESKKYKTFWRDSKFDASTYGTELLEALLGKPNPFDYPKSLYAVFECLKAACLARKNALIVDFFAGSGTTLHATTLLNAADDGNRRCILVTNNEISEAEADQLTKQGYRPGDLEWEQRGICREVAWPRCKYSILGKNEDKGVLEGDYFTGRTIAKEQRRHFKQIGFVTPGNLKTLAKKKQLVALIENISQSEVKKDVAFVVSDKCVGSILFDDDEAAGWLEALEDQDHVTDFYIVTERKTLFDDLVSRINGMFDPIIREEEEKRPMRDGFKANLEYFRLDFLEKNSVTLGLQFREILPILWLRSGAIGPRPDLSNTTRIPDMLIPEQNAFAVLVDETHYAAFVAALEQRQDVTHVFLVTDSEEAFQEMAASLSAPHIIQLYQDYLENFMINREDRA